MEWISKRAYSLWEEAGRPHGHDAEHWGQAVREREEFERVALAPDTNPAGAKKPLIEISKKAQVKKAETARPKKQTDADEKRPAAAKVAAKVKSPKDANSKPA